MHVEQQQPRRGTHQPRHPAQRHPRPLRHPNTHTHHLPQPTKSHTCTAATAIRHDSDTAIRRDSDTAIRRDSDTATQRDSDTTAWRRRDVGRLACSAGTARTPGDVMQRMRSCQRRRRLVRLPRWYPLHARLVCGKSFVRFRCALCGLLYSGNTAKQPRLRLTQVRVRAPSQRIRRPMSCGGRLGRRQTGSAPRGDTQGPASALKSDRLSASSSPRGARCDWGGRRVAW